MLAIGTVLEFAGGLLLTLLVLSDIFRTILLPRPTDRALRLSPLIGRAITPVWFKLTARIRRSRPRQTVRASLGPLLIVSALLLWVSTLVLGFGLMFHAQTGGANSAPAFGEALYTAGSAFFTLGTGNTNATGAGRFILLVAGLFGLASVTIGATFLLAVQQALHRREVLVLSTLTAAGAPPSGVTLLESYGRHDLREELPQLFREWERWSADVLHSHRSDPVLLHFRSTDEDGEWLAVWAAVLDAASLLLATAEDERQGSSAARLLLPIGCRTAHALARLLDLPSGKELSQDAPDDSEFHAARKRLQNAGYRLVANQTQSFWRFVELREDYAPSLAAIAARLHIRMPEPFERGRQAPIMKSGSASPSQEARA